MTVSCTPGTTVHYSTNSVVKQMCSPHNSGLRSIDAIVYHGLTTIIAAGCCYDLVTSTPIPELQYIQPPLQDSIPSSPLVQPCTNTFPTLRSDPTPRYILPFVFPLRALLHITLLVIPCPLFGDARLFPSYSYPISSDFRPTLPDFPYTSTMPSGLG